MADVRKKVAHELRNLLGLIALEVHAAAGAVADREATRRSLDEIGTLVARCTAALAELESSGTSSAATDAEGRPRS